MSTGSNSNATDLSEVPATGQSGLPSSSISASELKARRMCLTGAYRPPQSYQEAREDIFRPGADHVPPVYMYTTGGTVGVTLPIDCVGQHGVAEGSGEGDEDGHKHVNYGKLTKDFFNGPAASAAAAAPSNANWTEVHDDTVSHAASPGDTFRGGDAYTQMGTNVDFYDPRSARGMTPSDLYQAATEGGAMHWTYGSSNPGTAIAASYGDNVNAAHTRLNPQQLAPSSAQATSLAPWANTNPHAPESAGLQSSRTYAGAGVPAGMQEIQYHSAGLPGSKPGTQNVASMNKWKQFNHAEGIMGRGTRGSNWEVMGEGPSSGGAIFVAYNPQNQNPDTTGRNPIVEDQESSKRNLTWVPCDPQGGKYE